MDISKKILYIFAVVLAVLIGQSVSAATLIHQCDDDGTIEWVANSLYQDVHSITFGNPASYITAPLKCDSGTDCELGTDTGDGYVACLSSGLSVLAQFCGVPDYVCTAGTTCEVPLFAVDGVSCTGETAGDTYDLDNCYYLRFTDRPLLDTGTWESYRASNSTDSCANEVEKNNSPWDVMYTAYEDNPYETVHSITDVNAGFVKIWEFEEYADWPALDELTPNAYPFTLQIITDEDDDNIDRIEAEIYHVTSGRYCYLYKDDLSAGERTFSYLNSANEQYGQCDFVISPFNTGTYTTEITVVFDTGTDTFDVGTWTVGTIADWSQYSTVGCDETDSYGERIVCYLINSIVSLFVPNPSTAVDLIDGANEGDNFSIGALIAGVFLDIEDGIDQADGSCPLSNSYVNYTYVGTVTVPWCDIEDHDIFTTIVEAMEIPLWFLAYFSILALIVYAIREAFKIFKD